MKKLMTLSFCLLSSLFFAQAQAEIQLASLPPAVIDRLIQTINPESGFSIEVRAKASSKLSVIYRDAEKNKNAETATKVLEAKPHVLANLLLLTESKYFAAFQSAFTSFVGFNASKEDLDFVKRAISDVAVLDHTRKLAADSYLRAVNLLEEISDEERLDISSKLLAFLKETNLEKLDQNGAIYAYLVRSLSYSNSVPFKVLETNELAQSLNAEYASLYATLLKSLVDNNFKFTVKELGFLIGQMSSKSNLGDKAAPTKLIELVYLAKNLGLDLYTLNALNQYFLLIWNTVSEEQKTEIEAYAQSFFENEDMDLFMASVDLNAKIKAFNDQQEEAAKESSEP